MRWMWSINGVDRLWIRRMGERVFVFRKYMLIR